jgi:hypothetical protein
VSFVSCICFLAVFRHFVWVCKRQSLFALALSFDRFASALVVVDLCHLFLAFVSWPCLDILFGFVRDRVCLR